MLREFKSYKQGLVSRLKPKAPQGGTALAAFPGKASAMDGREEKAPGPADLTDTQRDPHPLLYLVPSVRGQVGRRGQLCSQDLPGGGL